MTACTETSAPPGSGVRHHVDAAAHLRDVALEGAPPGRPIPGCEPPPPGEGEIGRLPRLWVVDGPLPSRPAAVAVPAEPTPREREFGERFPSVRPRSGGDT
jgi:hypothetical protein